MKQFTLFPVRIASNVQNCLLEANMNNAAQPQPIPPADADMALLFLGSWFENLLHAPERHQATLDALAGHIILGERPKTLLGLVITAVAEKWLRRQLWMVDFDSLTPSDQGVRVVIDAVLRSCSRGRMKRASGEDWGRNARFRSACPTAVRCRGAERVRSRGSRCGGSGC